MQHIFKSLEYKILVTNSELQLKRIYFSKRELFREGKKFLIITLITLTYKYFLKEKLTKSNAWNYTLDGIIWFGFIIFIVLIVFAFFYYNFSKTIQIEDIKEIEVDKWKKNIDVIIRKSNNQVKLLEFEKSDTEYEKLIDILKKRNTRMKITET